jgi:NAD(P)-dependent dehydrogenase (short-subunit alcohol dehydrogenase family)
VRGRDRVVVLTGCTRGCGRALAEFLFGEGATVIGCGRSATTDAPVADFSRVDVSDDAAVRAWASRVIEKFGAPDLLVNNAAVIARNAPLWDVPPAEVAAVLDVNVRGTINVLRHFLPAMRESRRGVVVNFSSGWGRSTSPEVATYCASKWAIEGLTRALAHELAGSGVTAVALNPGIIDTDMLRSCFGEGAGAYPSPAAWAKAAGPFLLSLGSKHHGRSLDVPGVPVD